MPPKSVHVVMKEGRWLVVHEDGKAPASAHDRKLDAVREAIKLASRFQADIVVFGLDGRPDPRFKAAD